MEKTVKRETRSPTQIEFARCVEFGNSNSRNFWKFDYLYINCDGQRLLAQLQNRNPAALSKYMEKNKGPLPQNVDQSVVMCGGRLLTQLPFYTKPWWVNKQHNEQHNEERSKLLESLLIVARAQNFSLETLPTENDYANIFHIQCAKLGFDPKDLIEETDNALTERINHNVALDHAKMDLENTIGQISDMKQGGLLINAKNWNFANVEALIHGLAKAGLINYSGKYAYTRIFNVQHTDTSPLGFALGRLATVCEYTGQKG